MDNMKTQKIEKEDEEEEEEEDVNYLVNEIDAYLNKGKKSAKNSPANDSDVLIGVDQTTES